MTTIDPELPKYLINDRDVFQLNQLTLVGSTNPNTDRKAHIVFAKHAHNDRPYMGLHFNRPASNAIINFPDPQLASCNVVYSPINTNCTIPAFVSGKVLSNNGTQLQWVDGGGSTSLPILTSSYTGTSRNNYYSIANMPVNQSITIKVEMTIRMNNSSNDSGYRELVYNCKNTGGVLTVVQMVDQKFDSGTTNTVTTSFQISGTRLDLFTDSSNTYSMKALIFETIC